MSSHDLESEKGRWNRTPKGEIFCKQCNDNVEESLRHFLFECKHFQHIRCSYPDYPNNKSLFSFYNWEQSDFNLEKLHTQRI